MNNSRQWHFRSQSARAHRFPAHAGPFRFLVRKKKRWALGTRMRQWTKFSFQHVQDMLGWQICVKITNMTNHHEQYVPDDKADFGKVITNSFSTYLPITSPTEAFFERSLNHEL